MNRKLNVTNIALMQHLDKTLEVIELAFLLDIKPTKFLGEMLLSPKVRPHALILYGRVGDFN